VPITRFCEQHELSSAQGLDCSGVGWLLLRRVLLLLLSLPVVAFAQPSLPTDGAIYVGRSERGRTVLVTLYLFPDRAELRLLEAPPRADQVEPGERDSFELTLIGNYLEHPRVLEVTTENWAFYADTLPDGSLDSRGGGQYQTNLPRSIEFEAIGTIVHGGLSFADGSFAVQRLAPFFYWDPWNQITFDLALEEDVEAGLPQHDQVSVVPVETYAKSRVVHLAALDRNLISYYTLIETNMGGDSFTRRLTTTFMREARGSWEEVTDVCEAAGRLGWECDEATLYSKVIDDLRRQDAGPVEEGAVYEETQGLLDSFVLTPDGIVFLFDDSQAGPNASSPFEFEVDLPYSELSN
jgi:hypothetical protein